MPNNFRRHSKPRRSVLELLESRQLLDANGLLLAADTAQTGQNAGRSRWMCLQTTISIPTTLAVAGSRQSVNGTIVYTPPEDALSRQSPATADTLQYTVNGQLTGTVRVWLRDITLGDHYHIDRPVQQTLDVLNNDKFNQDYRAAAIITAISVPSSGGSLSIAPGGRSSIYRPGSEREAFPYTVDDRFTEAVTISPIRRLAADHAVANQNGTGFVIDVTANDFPSN